jgi:hypothetical protein
MKNLLLAPVIALGLLLGACQGAGTVAGPVIPGVGGTPVTSASVRDFATRVMAGAVRICGFQPLFDVAASFAGLGSVSAISQGICSALVAPRASAGVGLFAASTGPPTYKGVVLQGNYVGR